MVPILNVNRSSADAVAGVMREVVRELRHTLSNQKVVLGFYPHHRNTPLLRSVSLEECAFRRRGPFRLETDDVQDGLRADLDVWVVPGEFLEQLAGVPCTGGAFRSQ